LTFLKVLQPKIIKTSFIESFYVTSRVKYLQNIHYGTNELFMNFAIVLCHDLLKV